MVRGEGCSSKPPEPTTDLCSFARVCTALAYKVQTLIKLCPHKQRLEDIGFCADPVI